MAEPGRGGEEDRGITTESMSESTREITTEIANERTMCVEVIDRGIHHTEEEVKGGRGETGPGMAAAATRGVSGQRRDRAGGSAAQTGVSRMTLRSIMQDHARSWIEVLNRTT